MTGTDAHFIRQLVHTFDRTERLLLMLHYVEELTTTEIALVLDLGEAEVCETLERIRQQTRDAVAEYRIAS